MNESNYSNVNKSNKGLVVLVIVLMVCIVGLVGYIVYDKCISKDNKISTETNISTDTNNKQINNELKQVTDSTLVEKLRNELVVDDTRADYHTINGLYYNQKITSSDANNKYLIGFSVRKYIAENNVLFDPTCNNRSELGACVLASINKSDISNYMDKKYNTNIDYSYLSSSQDDRLDKNYTSLMAYSNIYNLEVVSHSGANVTIKTQLVKAEEDNENVYIYDKAVTCVGDMGVSCDSSIETAYTPSLSIYSCDMNGTGDICSDVNAAANHVLNNMSDKLKTYKHTFKKVNGNYYWVSTEVE